MGIGHLSQALALLLCLAQPCLLRLLHHHAPAYYSVLPSTLLTIAKVGVGHNQTQILVQRVPERRVLGLSVPVLGLAPPLSASSPGPRIPRLSTARRRQHRTIQ
eukprot:1252412-Rhodomonas_salina.5